MYRKLAMGFEADQYLNSDARPHGSSSSSGGGSREGQWRDTPRRPSEDGIMRSTEPSDGRPVGSLLGRPFFPAVEAAGEGDIPHSPEQVRGAETLAPDGKQRTPLRGVQQPM